MSGKIRKVSIELGSPRSSMPRQVEAIAVGGEYGVFAVAEEGNTVRLLGGDDGHWWEMAVYHKDWLPAIITALRRVS